MNHPPFIGLRASWKAADIERIEINEAFAASVIVLIRGATACGAQW